MYSILIAKELAIRFLNGRKPVHIFKHEGAWWIRVFRFEWAPASSLPVGLEPEYHRCHSFTEAVDLLYVLCPKLAR